ncbi:MAG: NTP transferase domain-containing protein [Candidatus Eisenbacteria bacterium]|nr:NTP transferase domain-containing protein [Candidatus Eisenbacteria bacterium]
MTQLRIIVLAAGKGTRMPDDMPKVLRPLSGQPLLEYVLETARALQPRQILLVLGHRAEEIRTALGEGDCEIVLQPEQRGTGDAVLRAEDQVSGGDCTALILYGDVPLLRVRTLRELLELHAVEGNAVTILTAELNDPRGYGRIVRDAAGRCAGIVEQRDLAPGQAEIREINSGILAVRMGLLFEALHRIRPDNEQGEYYLTDVVEILHAEGHRIGCYCLSDPDEIRGVNTLAQLELLERILAQRRGDQDAECELCAAAEGPPQSSLLLAQGETVRLYVASHPFNSGHMLLVPKRHITSFLSLSEAEREEISVFLERGEELLRRAYHYEGLNIGYNSGAGEHLALHLVPRWGGDLNYLPLLAGLKLVPENPQSTWERLREAMK